MKTLSKHTLELGAAWYPEQFAKDTWQKDIDAMRDLGLTAVRIGEFAWACLEPEEGRYTVDWLIEVLDLLAANEMGAVVCTPTATPPFWLM